MKITPGYKSPLAASNRAREKRASTTVLRSQHQKDLLHTAVETQSLSFETGGAVKVQQPSERRTSEGAEPANVAILMDIAKVSQCDANGAVQVH